MKRILFVINNFKTGGIQKSLVELLQLISDRYDVSVYASDFSGPYTNQIPGNVKVIPSSRFAKMLEYPRWEYRKVGGLFNYIIKLVLGWLTSKVGKKRTARFYCHLLGHIPGEYDWAISYGQPIDDHSFHNLENEIVLNCTRAKRRATFVHCDYAEYGGNTEYNHTLYTRFDAIAAVSKSVAKRFVSVLPDLKDRVSVVYNACNDKVIQEQSALDPVYYSLPCFVSVCRLSPVKGLFRCVEIFEQLKDEGFRFEWHIIGGGDETYLNDMHASIKICNLEDSVFLEGEQINPYRFMKNANYLFLPSFHEAAPMVFNEAFCLGLRVITTDTLSAKELVESRSVGIVCKNDVNSIYTALKKALKRSDHSHLSGSLDEWNDTVKTQFDALID